jgi:membrane-associated protease RseP (regulator of RpoE activity)
MLTAAYTLVFDEAPGIPEQFQELASGGSLAALAVMAVMACVWAPVAEELFFRRFVLRALAERFALPAAIALQAFVFAILHDYGGMHLAAIFVLGLAMGGLYAWRKTILTSMILHMLQNTLAVTVIGIVILIGRLAPPLGVFGEPDTAGFRIAEVLDHSAAAEAGLQPGDVITDVEGTPVRDVVSLRLMYWAAGLDGSAELKVRRGDETFNINVRPGANPPHESRIDNGDED